MYEIYSHLLNAKINASTLPDTASSKTEQRRIWLVQVRIRLLKLNSAFTLSYESPLKWNFVANYIWVLVIFGMFRINNASTKGSAIQIYYNKKRKKSEKGK